MRAPGGSLRLWLALATIYLVWGSTYLAIRVMVETMPPLLSAGARFLLAGLILLGILVARGGIGRITLSRREVLAAAGIAVLLLAGGNGLVSVAEQDAPSGLAALIIGAVPLWVVVLRLAARERVPPVTLAGVLVGIAGVAFLVVPSDRPDDAPLWSLLVLVAAALAWGTGSFLSPRVALPKDVFVATGVQMVLGGLALTFAGLAAGEAPEVEPQAFSPRSLAAFAFLVLAGSLLAFTAYVWLLHAVPISTVATYAFVNPVVAVLLGWALLAEEVTLPMVAGAAAIVVSVAFVVRTEGGAGA